MHVPNPSFAPRRGGVDEASPSDGATALMLAIQKDRADVMRDVRWAACSIACMGLLACRLGVSFVWRLRKNLARCPPTAQERPAPLPAPPVQILKHSSRWSLLVDGKPWTPLCYALAQASVGCAVRCWLHLWPHVAKHSCKHKHLSEVPIAIAHLRAPPHYPVMATEPGRHGGTAAGPGQAPGGAAAAGAARLPG